ncbi:MAG TPA: YciI family protein [Mucilaginibacter sp.]
MIPASAYKNPHHVMLFFEKNEINVTDTCMDQRVNYYENLKNDGKVVLSGDFWNQPRNFVIVHVTSDTELEQIINNDPAIRENVLELVRAMPF